MVRAQIEQVAHDVEIAAVKTGMLVTGDIVRAVSETVGRFRHPNLVVDPVMTASGRGTRTLLAPEAVSILKTRLLPVATVVTPNVAEAEALSGIQVDSMTSAREAAKRIAGMGAAAVVIKGGHLSGPEASTCLFHDGNVPRACGAADRARRDTRHGLHVCVSDCRRARARRRRTGRRPAREALHLRRDRAFVRNRPRRADPQSLLGPAFASLKCACGSPPYNRRARLSRAKARHYVRRCR